jgi:hypothetical protein
MNSKLNSIVITSFIVFAIIAAGIPTIFENVFAQGEKEAEQRQNQSLPTLDDNNNGIIISEEICPPYCSPPPLIQELPQEKLNNAINE